MNRNHYSAASCLVGTALATVLSSACVGTTLRYVVSGPPRGAEHVAATGNTRVGPHWQMRTGRYELRLHVANFEVIERVEHFIRPKREKVERSMPWTHLPVWIAIEPRVSGLSFDPSSVKLLLPDGTVVAPDDEFVVYRRSRDAAQRGKVMDWENCLYYPTDPGWMGRNVTRSVVETNGPLALEERTCIRLLFKASAPPSTSFSIQVDGIAVDGRVLPIPPFAFGPVRMDVFLS